MTPDCDGKVVVEELLGCPGPEPRERYGAAAKRSKRLHRGLKPCRGKYKAQDEAAAVVEGAALKWELPSPAAVLQAGICLRFSQQAGFSYGVSAQPTLILGYELLCCCCFRGKGEVKCRWLR